MEPEKAQKLSSNINSNIQSLNWLDFYNQPKNEGYANQSIFNGQGDHDLKHQTQQLTTNGFFSKDPSQLARIKQNEEKESELVTSLREKIKQLKQQLASTKIFLNMVIHEMRNPALSIELALQEVLKVFAQQLQAPSTYLNKGDKSDYTGITQDITYQGGNSASQVNLLSQSYAQNTTSKIDGTSNQFRYPVVEQLKSDHEYDQLIEIQQKRQEILKNKNKNYKYKTIKSILNKTVLEPSTPYLNPIQEHEEEKNDFTHKVNNLYSFKPNCIKTQTQEFEGFDQLIVTNRSSNHHVPYVLNIKSNKKILGEELIREAEEIENDRRRQEVISFPEVQYIEEQKCESPLKINLQIQSLQKQNASQEDEDLIYHNNFQTTQPLAQKDVVRKVYSTLSICGDQKNKNQPSSNIKQGINMQNRLSRLNTQTAYMEFIEQFLQNSLYSSKMILNLVNDLLDLAKMENQSFNLHSNYFNLFETIQMSIQNIQFQADQKQIQVVHEYFADDSLYFISILGDQNRYFQILLNFLSNSIKFTPSGGNILISTLIKETQNISLSRKFNQMDESFNQNNNSQSQRRRKSHSIEKINDDCEIESLFKYIDFEIRIKDSGLGIAKQNIGKLFMNFSRLQEHASINETGTGLGLSICKSLIEAMGGSVKVESEPNQGTTFIVQLKTKCKYVSQVHAKQVLKSLEQKYNSNQSRRISSIQVISSTQNHFKQPREKSKSSSSVLGMSYKNQSRSPQPRRISLMEQKGFIQVLLANDDPFTLQIMTMNLQQFNILVDQAENGLEALNKAKEKQYDFILLDLSMPVLNGFEACSKIKQAFNEEAKIQDITNTDKNLKQMPFIIAISGNISDEDIQRGKEVGFDDFSKCSLFSHLNVLQLNNH